MAGGPDRRLLAGYKLLRKALPGEAVSPAAFPHVVIAAADIIR